MVSKLNDGENDISSEVNIVIVPIGIRRSEMDAQTRIGQEFSFQNKHQSEGVYFHDA
jgi:hypothetical protein